MNKKTFVIIIALVILAIAGAAAYYYIFIRQPQVANFEQCAAAGYPIQESYPRQCRAPRGDLFREDIGNELEKINLIKLEMPRPNQTITSPLVIKGEARGYWFFEASFPVKLYSAEKLLATGIAQAQKDWMTEEFVPFETTLEFLAPTAGQGSLILLKDNPSGLPENDDALIVPVKFGAAPETTNIKIFFNNTQLDPEVSCNKVFPVERIIPKTPAVARAALEELLKGVTQAEKNAGFFTSLNSGIRIKSLTIINGVAKVDFDEQLEFQVGGSCRVAAIRSQIIETLKQFPSVASVVISINGRTEDILQP